MTKPDTGTQEQHCISYWGQYFQNCPMAGLICQTNVNLSRGFLNGSQFIIRSIYWLSLRHHTYYYNYKYCHVLYDTGYISELVDICESLSQTVPLVADEVFLVADVCWPLFIRTMAFDPRVTLVNCN